VLEYQILRIYYKVNAAATHIVKSHKPKLKPKLAKECVCPNPERISKFFSHALKKKIKTRQHTGDTDRKENETNDKFNMKMQFDSDTRTDKNRQCITGGIFYCRDSAGFSVSASNKLSCNLTGQCFEIGNKNIPPIR